MDMMKGKFFTSPRILSSLVAFLVSIGLFYVSGSLMNTLYESSKVISTLTFFTLGMFPTAVISGVGVAGFLVVRFLLGRYYLDESLERSVIFSVVEIIIWVSVLLGLTILFVALES